MKDRDTQRIAVAAFFTALRREWLVRCPDSPSECPVPAWELIAAVDQASFIKCMGAALKAAEPLNVARVLEAETEAIMTKAASSAVSQN